MTVNALADAATRTEIHFAGLPLWVFLLLASALVVVVVLGYRRDRGLAPVWVGRVLTALRAAAVILLLAVFLEGALRRVGEEVLEKEVLFVLDGSRSMALEDGFRPAWQKAREAQALGLLPEGREVSFERAAAAIPDLKEATALSSGWDRMRAWGESHGVPRAELDAAIGQVTVRLEAARESAAGSGGAGSREMEELRKVLESLQRRLDEALLSGGTGSARPALSKLEGVGRLDLARAILTGALPGAGGGPAGGSGPGGGDAPLRRIARRFRIAAAVLGRGPEEPAVEAGALPEVRPNGAWTDLTPIADLAARRGREALAGVVLITDGRHNHGKRPDEAARALGELGIPLFALGTGSEEEPQDLRLEEVDAAGKVFGGDQVRVDVALASVGLGELPVPIRISEGERTVTEVTVKAPGGLSHHPVEFAAPKEGSSGPRKYTASFPLQPGEVTAANNSRDFWVNVLTEKARVLLLDGGPRWEYRYVKNVLGRDPNVKLDSFLLTRPPDRRLPPDFPRDRESLFQYDVVMIGDVEASVFAREDLQALRDFVAARGASLVLIAGERAMPYDYAGTPLEDLLPVRLRRPPPPPGEGAALARAGFRPRLTAEGERSPITRLVPGREPNRELWSRLPSLEWFAPALGAKSSASVLAALPDEFLGPASGADWGGKGAMLPERDRDSRGALLAILPVAAGRVLYSGLDSTWKWRFPQGDQLIARFWGQLVRWGASERLPAGDDHVRIGTDEVRYQAPARVNVRALVQASEGKPLEDAVVDAVVRHAGGSERRLRLEPIPQSGGLYRGSLEVEVGPGGAGIGEYSVRVEVAGLAGYTERPDRTRATFQVEEAPSPEAGDLSRDVALLKELARRSGPGGCYLPIDRAGELPDLLPERSVKKERVTTVEQWVLAWPLLLLFAALVGAEWCLRKRYDLA